MNSGIFTFLTFTTQYTTLHRLPIRNSPHDDCLPKIGPQLTSIQINCLKPTTLWTLRFRTSSQASQSLARIWPGWTSSFMNGRYRHTFFPENVHILGIKVNVYQIPRRSLVTLFKTIRDFLFRFSSVKTISFIDQHNVRTVKLLLQILPKFLPLVSMWWTTRVTRYGINFGGNVYFDINVMYNILAIKI